MLNFFRRFFSKPSPADPLPAVSAPVNPSPDRYREFLVEIIPLMVVLTYKYKNLLGLVNLIDQVSFRKELHPSSKKLGICVVFTISPDIACYTEICDHIEGSIRKVANRKNMDCFSTSEYNALTAAN